MKKAMVSLGLIICFCLVAQTFAVAYEAGPDGGSITAATPPTTIIPPQIPNPVFTPLQQEKPPVNQFGGGFVMKIEVTKIESPLGRISEIPTANIDRPLSNRHMPD